MLRTLLRGATAALGLLVAGPLAMALEPQGTVGATATQPDGKVVFAAADRFTSGYVALGRLNPDGTRDTSLGGGQPWVLLSQATGNLEVKALAVHAEGKLLLHMMSDGQTVFMRLNGDGSPDTTFGSGGTGTVVDLQAPAVRIGALVPAADGKVLGFGSIDGAEVQMWGRVAAVVRYNADGSRDLGFGTSGNGVQVGSWPLMGHYHTARAGSDGAVLAAGYYEGGGGRSLLLARHFADGAADLAFGPYGTGFNIAHPTFHHEEAFALAVDNAGDIIVAGRTAQYWEPWAQGNLLTARFTAAGLFVDHAEQVIPLPGTPYPTHAVGMAIVASPSGGLVVGANVHDYNDGQPRIALVHLGTGVTRVLPAGSPLGRGITSLHNAPGEQLVVLGSTSLSNVPSALRLRFFADGLEYDTDFETEGLYDPQPNPFSIPPVVGAAPGTEVTSEPFRITGINVPATVYGDGALVSVGCNEPFMSFAYVANGEYLCARVTAGPQSGMTTTGTVFVETESAAFTVSTVGPPQTTITQAPPDPSGSMVVFYYSGDAGSGPVIGYECRFDGGAFQPCNEGHQGFGPLSVGPHTFEVRAINSFGPDATPASYAWTVAPPPETTITSAPLELSSVRTASFSFISSEGGPNFLCQLDSATSWTPCTSPQSYTLPDGPHTFRVYAIGALDSDWASPAEHRWRIDTVPPDTDIVAYSGFETYSATAWFSFVAVGEAASKFVCRVDGGPWFDCPGGSATVTVSPGTHRFEVSAVDAAGNIDQTPDAKDWVYVATPPETIITGGPSGTTNATSAWFTYESTQTGVTFECGLADVNGIVAFQACPAQGAGFGNLGDGRHVFRVRARNAGGVVDPSPAEREWFVDLTAPATTITAGPVGTVNNAGATFEFAANESGASFGCSLDGAPFAACTSPASFSNLADGSHTFAVRAVDAVGNLGEAASRTWQVDRTGPDTSLTSAPSGSVAVAVAQFAFASNEPGATFECRLDAEPFAPCASPASYGGLADGPHAFEVRAVDALGNVDPSPAAASWTVDTSAPDTAIDSGPSGTVAQAGATFTFSASEPGTTFECSLDAAPFVACSSGVSYAGLASGMHLFEVRALDALGNADATPASRTWAVDLTGPATTITTGPSVVTASTTATFAFASDEPGTFMCSLDGAAFTACSSPVSYAGLASGSHAFAVYGIDTLGNVDPSPATWSWVIDALAPDTVITSGPSGNNNPATATFTHASSEEGSTFECRLDGGAFLPCGASVTYTGLPKGWHTFEVRAIDAAGNVDATPATRTWRSNAN